MQRRTLCAAILSAALTGCATTGGNDLVRTAEQNQARAFQTKPTLYAYSETDARAAAEVVLPANYNPDNYRKMTIAVSFYPMDESNADRFAKGKSEVVTSVFETEIVKLRRFTVLSRTQLGAQAIADEKRHQDKGLVKTSDLMRLGRQKGAQYVLTGGITLKTENFNRLSNSEIFFNVLVNYQLINIETGEIEEADTAEGRAKRTYYATPSGKHVGGFNLNSPKDMQVAWNDASYQALRIIANKIGNKFPVGGKVSGILGSRVQVKAGFDQGLMGKQVAVLYSNVGVDLPLAYVMLEPGKSSTSGTVISWSRAPEAQSFIAQIQQNGMAFLRDNPDTYIVSKAMPLPPEWDKNYQDQDI